MLEYQFKKNGVAIDGATSNTLSLVNIDENDNGNYTLTVTETTTGKSRKFGPLAVGVSGVSPSPGPIAYDYLIESDADWTTVFANNDATLAGKTIAVAPGGYTTKTLTSRNPASTVKIAALYSNDKPAIDRLTISGCSKLTIEDLEVVSSLWSDSASGTGALTLTGSCSDLAIRRCDFRGNYRGTVDDPTFDVTSDSYPEYACILPIFNDSGVVTGFSVTRDYVGDLLADGTYSMVFNNYTVTFTVAPVASFTVSGGVITGTTLTSGGASNGTSTTGSGIRSALVTWTGQRRMKNWMTRGIHSNALTLTGTLDIEDCSFSLCGSGMKGSLGDSATVTFSGDTFDRIYEDFMSFGSGARWTIKDCFGTRPFSKSGDAGDPHVDFVQFLGGAFDKSNLVIERNIFIDGVTRGAVQGIFIEDTTDSFNVIRPRIVGNCILSRSATNGITLTNIRDAFVYANLVARYDPTNVTNTNAVALTVKGGNVSGDNIIGATISEGITNDSSVLDTSTFPNAVLGLNGATIPYGDVFANHTGTRATVAEIVAAYTPKPAYAGLGPFANTSYINHVAKTTNLSLEPSYLRFTNLNSQAVSSTITSEWSALLGGPEAGNSISVSGGEYRTADDDDGTNATAWASTVGTVDRNKYVQLRHTSSVSGSTTTTTTVTIRGAYSYTFQSTTVSVLSFTAVDNQATAYSTFPAPANETSLAKLLLAVRFRCDVSNVNANVIAHDAAAIFRLWFSGATTLRFQLLGSIITNMRPTAAHNTGTTKTHIISLDFSNTNANQGCFWATDVDGVLLNTSAGTGGTFDT
jgi:hypothetical protein